MKTLAHQRHPTAQHVGTRRTDDIKNANPRPLRREVRLTKWWDYMLSSGYPKRPDPWHELPRCQRCRHADMVIVAFGEKPVQWLYVRRCKCAKAVTK